MFELSATCASLTRRSGLQRFESLESCSHLDLSSIERLEEAVAGYPGAVLLVSHDSEFGANTTTTTWHLENGELKPER